MMTYRTKLALDRILGRPASFFLNMAALLTGFLLRRDHRVHNLNNRTIAICKIVGLGSITEFAPMLRAVKEKFASAEIIFITSIANKELMELLSNYIDQPIYINDRGFFSLLSSSCRVVFSLITKRIDTFINLAGVSL